MNLTELREVLGMHCALCNTMAEHLNSPHLAVAQHALLCIATHQLSPDAHHALMLRIMQKLDMGRVRVEDSAA